MAASSHGKTLNALHILVLSVLLVSQCNTIKDAPGYFDNPMINFGDYFYISFPNGTLDLFFECFCDLEIMYCSMTHELVDSLTTQFSFPYYYIITRFVQYRDVPPRRRYTASMLCTPLRYLPKDDINCIRLTEGENLCENISCLHSALHFQNDTCSLDCTMMIWMAQFFPKIIPINFGSRPQINIGSVCPGFQMSPTPAYSVGYIRIKEHYCIF